VKCASHTSSRPSHRGDLPFKVDNATPCACIASDNVSNLRLVQQYLGIVPPRANLVFSVCCRTGAHRQHLLKCSLQAAWELPWEEGAVWNRSARAHQGNPAKTTH